MEAGTNDLIVLPIVLVLVAVTTAGVGGPAEWALFLVQLFVVGPAVGAAVGAGGAWLMSRVDARFGIRSEYQALYGVGLVLAAFVAGEWAGADGFLAAFAGGAAVTLTNNALCDCFLEFGQVVAEMLMLLAFVLFGAVLSTMLGAVPLGPVLVFALVAVLVARPLAVGLVLATRRTTLSAAARAFIAWFGPRGLNSLLLALVVVRGGAPDAERLFTVVGMVVLVSVIIHGASATPVSSWYARRVAAVTLPEERESTAAGVLGGSTEDAPRIGADRLAELLGGADPPLVVDVRARSGFGPDAVVVPGSVRVHPDEVADWAQDQRRDRLIVPYCT